MSTMREHRNRKLFLLTLALLALLLAGSTRNPGTPAEYPAQEISSDLISEFSAPQRDGFSKLAEKEPHSLLQYCAAP